MGFSLELTEEQRDLVDRTHRFAEDVIRPVAVEYDREQGFPWPVLEQATEAGLYSPLLYAQLNQDPSGLSIPLMIEELFWGCAGIGLSIVYPALALAAIEHAATPEQLGRWAPECFGEAGDIKLAALAVTEPRGGSDVRSNTTTARREGDEWVIDGTKMFIGNGGIADVHVVNATVDPDLGHYAQSMFIVPKGTPGLKMVRKLDKLGARGSHHAEVAFENCRVPADHLLGGEEALEEKLDHGRKVLSGEGEHGTSGGSAALGAFEQTRPFVAAQAVGVARAAYEYARDYATEREAFGAPVIEYQGTAFPLADVAAAIDSARLLTWRAAWMAANKVPFRQAEGSMSKLMASEVAVQASERAVQTLGGWGYIYDHPVEKYYRDAKVFSIYEGTSEIQRLLIGRAIADQKGHAPLHHEPPRG
ncbi:MAG: acyl-CoA dehydrogenase family protein [Actinomycetota bacterium]|nr:acyl-CoA dehydrogenase family protein [Actinomycetota bacterium]